ncbi:MAG TPA: DUF4159 domain-containing protein [Bryobacteraceae bacterium]|nr:DUF4159 domain-containing protein [Bryobacteraceae bacterium]
MRTGRLKFLRQFACGLALLTLLITLLYAADRTLPRPFREYPGDEYQAARFPLPPDFDERTELVFARLMYPSIPDARFRHAGWDWTQGRSSWTNDYPRADRHFLEAVRRLTRLHVRSVEQPVSLDDPFDVYNYPWLYAVFVGEWDLTDAQAHTLREYLLRGGFLMCDDFWGSRDWTIFENSMKRIFPNRAVVEIPDSDPIFHTVYDLENRYQVPGEWGVRTGVPFRNDGYVAHWRGIYDDKGRLMVAISFNSDLGDSWEWADDPEYPEEYSALGIRIGVNYIVYSMTH